MINLIKTNNRKEEEFVMCISTGLSDMEDRNDGSISVEWDGPYGRHWETFNSNDELQKRIDRNNNDANELLLEFRAKQKQKAIEKQRKVKEIKIAKTLGGQFPILKELLILTRTQLAS